MVMPVKQNSQRKGEKRLVRAPIENLFPGQQELEAIRSAKNACVRKIIPGTETSLMRKAEGRSGKEDKEGATKCPEICCRYIGAIGIGLHRCFQNVCIERV